MGVLRLRESWCFCKGVSKTGRMKAAVFSGKTLAMARISGAACGTGFLIHRNLLLTTHVNLSSVAAAETAEIRLQSGAASASLVPHRIFITSSILDLTIVGFDSIYGDSNAQGQQPHPLKTRSKPNLDLGSVVFLLGYTDKNELAVGEGKVVIATDNLIKLSTDGVIWGSGSAGFDVQGNLAFMICDPMKLASSPNTKSSSTSTSSSSSSWKKDIPMQFGIPIPIICDWLNQHWEGSLDELTKSKLPLIRLVSAGQKSEHSCASFMMRWAFKSTEDYIDRTTPSSSNTISILKIKDQPRPGCSAAVDTVQGIPTPEIYESPKLTSVPIQKKESSQMQLIDINFPPRVAKAIVLPKPVKRLPLNSDENFVKEVLSHSPLMREEDQINPEAEAEISSTGSVNGAQSEVQSSSSPIEVAEMIMHNGCSLSSEGGETTMYSAETAESRNYYTSPREVKFQQLGRSQSCVGYNRWGGDNALVGETRRRRRFFILGKKMYYSQGAASSQRSNDYFSPTVASIMKKRNSEQRPKKPPQSAAVHSSPRWMF